MRAASPGVYPSVFCCSAKTTETEAIFAPSHDLLATPKPLPSSWSSHGLFLAQAQVNVLPNSEKTLP
jgi:hypothetical protein